MRRKLLLNFIAVLLITQIAALKGMAKDVIDGYTCETAGSACNFVEYPGSNCFFAYKMMVHSLSCENANSLYPYKVRQLTFDCCGHLKGDDPNSEGCVAIGNFAYVQSFNDGHTFHGQCVENPSCYIDGVKEPVVNCGDTSFFKKSNPNDLWIKKWGPDYKSEDIWMVDTSNSSITEGIKLNQQYRIAARIHCTPVSDGSDNDPLCTGLVEFKVMPCCSSADILIDNVYFSMPAIAGQDQGDTSGGNSLVLYSDTWTPQQVENLDHFCVKVKIVSFGNDAVQDNNTAQENVSIIWTSTTGSPGPVSFQFMNPYQETVTGSIAISSSDPNWQVSLKQGKLPYRFKMKPMEKRNFSFSIYPVSKDRITTDQVQFRVDLRIMEKSGFVQGGTFIFHPKPQTCKLDCYWLLIILGVTLTVLIVVLIVFFTKSKNRE